MNNSIGLARLSVLIKAAFIGLLAGEVFALATDIGEQIASLFTNSLVRYTALNVLGIGALISIGYLRLRVYKSKVKDLFQVARIDIVFVAALGFFVSRADGGVGSSWYAKLVSMLTPWAWVFLISIPVAIPCVLTIQSWFSRYYKPNKGQRFFISDTEITAADHDLMGLADRARAFAERVLNEGSVDSLVFGIDAPWGTGKSSFVNFCIEYWRTDCSTRTVVFKFNPLRYESKANLLEKFIDGLVETLQQSAFIPELGPAMSEYSRLIRAKEGLSIGGIKLNLFFLSQSVDDAYEALQSVLARSQKKIVIIVDDLDRLPLEQVKDILFTIKVGFPLPNVSYVLCYDTDNIASGRLGSEDVREFLEKFVNVKVGLFLDPEALARYVSTNLEVVLMDHPHIDPYTRTKIQDTVAALTEICRSSEFHYFQPYLGDIRKIKRLLNTILLLEIQGADFTNCDFNRHDLLYLLLVYINFPRIFRKIYNAETNGNWGFFSAVSYGDPGYPDDGTPATQNQSKPYRNSIGYTEYLNDLTEAQKFLLNKVFGLTSTPATRKPFDDNDNKVETSSACFNGTHGTQRNLEQYLYLIVRQSKPLRREQQQFYLNKVREFSDMKSIDAIFQADEFAFESGEDSRARFWRVLINKSPDVPPNAGSNAITYLMEHLPEYSLLDWAGTGLVGFRDDAAYILAKLLDRFGWCSSSRSRMANTADNIVEIAEWVFVDGRHEGQVVVQLLGAPARGPLGLYDLLVFRLMCCADRGGDIFNLTRAIAYHADENAPTSGLTSTIAVAEMRELSQIVFKIFTEQYVRPGKNLFDSIDAVTLEVFTGRYFEYACQQIKIHDVSDEQTEMAISRLRSQMKIFITYQLGNRLVSSGVGCGYYDVDGTGDQNGIAKEISDYLFDQCFAPEKGENNCLHFLDYAIANYGSRFSFESGPGYEFVPSVDELTKVLDRERLIQYWRSNHELIRGAAGRAEDRLVVTANYNFLYRDAAPRIFQVLDALISPPSQTDK